MQGLNIVLLVLLVRLVVFLSFVGIRTSTITSKGQIVIPSDVRKCDGFKSGQKVTIFAFDDKIEIVPLGNIDWEAERKKNRVILQKVVDKYGLRGKKIRELTHEERDKLAMDYFEQARKASNKE